MGKTFQTGGSGGVSGLAAIGASPNANSATLTGSTLNLEPANGSFGGVVTTAAQTIAGIKTFSSYTNSINHVDGYTTTATAAGTTTLTVASNKQQFFTGVTTQTVVLPVTSTLVLGLTYIVTNKSTGMVTVQSSGANSIVIQRPLSTVIYTCILTSGTTAASWATSLDDKDVSARACTSAGAALVDNTNLRVDFATVTWDPYSTITTGAGTWAFTAPMSGVYHVDTMLSAQTGTGFNDTTDQFGLYLTNGGVAVSRRFMFPNATNRVESCSISDKMRLLTGEIIYVLGYQFSGGNITLSAVATENYIAISRIGNY